MVAEPVTTIFVVLDNFNRVAVFNVSRQPVTDVTATGNNDAFVGAFFTTQFTHDRTDIARFRDEEYFIIGLNHRGTLRNNRAVFAEDGSNPGIN